jgi:hypothetical protein
MSLPDPPCDETLAFPPADTALWAAARKITHGCEIFPEGASVVSSRRWATSTARAEIDTDALEHGAVSEAHLLQ